MNKPILVSYLDVRGMSHQQSNEYMQRVRRIVEYEENIFHYLIPIKGETRVECVNPVLATEEEYNKIKQLIEEYQEKLNRLN